MASTSQQSGGLQQQLEAFEQQHDPGDPEQSKLLELMREETRRLQQVRGQWNVPTTHRDWNDPRAAVKEQAPLVIEEYRQYKQHLHGQAATKLLPAPKYV